MPARSSRFGFAAGALSRVLVVVAIAVLVAAAVTSVETKSFTSEAVHHVEIRIQTTCPIARWSVEQKGKEIAQIDADVNFWYGVVHQENGPVHIEARTKAPGPTAMRVDISSSGRHLEQVFWGEDAVSATVRPDALNSLHEHRHD